MSRRTVLAAVSLASVLGVGLAACGNDKPSDSAAASSRPAPHRPTADVDVPTAKQLIAEGATVIDVRMADEFADGHLPNARNIPHDEVGARAAEIEQAAGGKDRPVVVYCGTGPRASIAKVTLEAAGFTAVVNGGGFRALRAP